MAKVQNETNEQNGHVYFVSINKIHQKRTPGKLYTATSLRQRRDAVATSLRRRRDVVATSLRRKSFRFVSRMLGANVANKIVKKNELTVCRQNGFLSLYTVVATTSQRRDKTVLPTVLPTKPFYPRTVLPTVRYVDFTVILSFEQIWIWRHCYQLWRDILSLLSITKFPKKG